MTRKTKTGYFQTYIFSSGGSAQTEKRRHFLPITLRINGKMLFGAKTNDGKTCMYGSETNCVGACLFYILNKDVQRKVSVELRKINSTNNTLGAILMDSPYGSA